MSLTVKRRAKTAALGIVGHRGSNRPDMFSAAALRLMKIRLEPGLDGPYLGGGRGAACVSVDFDVTSSERYLWNHDGTAALLRLSEKHDIPLTWAICGKSAEEDPSAYESILLSSTRQEIGVHTYSHLYADEVTEVTFEADIEKCLKVLGSSHHPTTFVFPKNREGHFSLLQRLGFRSYRGGQRVVGAPIKNSGLWNIRPVYYVDQKSLQAVHLIQRFIDVCISRGAVFHLWTHPWSLAIGGKVDKMASDVFDPILGYVAEKRAAGILSVSTMGELSNFMGSLP